VLEGATVEEVEVAGTELELVLVEEEVTGAGVVEGAADEEADDEATELDERTTDEEEMTEEETMTDGEETGVGLDDEATGTELVAEQPPTVTVNVRVTV